MSNVGVRGRKAEVVEQPPRQLLTFQLGGEPFAIAIQAIREIIEYGSVTEVPLMPEFIRGVLNLRGAVVPVIDLAARFGRARTEIGQRSCIIILELESLAEGEDEGSQVQEIGVVVDAVSEVMEVPQDQIQPAPPFGARIRADFVSGMVELDGRFVIILDVGRVLSVDEMALLASLEAGEDETMAEAVAE
jgi:purine-binding chemotaxis protein CheW